MQQRAQKHAANNTESFITGFRSQNIYNKRPIRHLKIEDESIFEFYEQVQLIGKGNYGTVYEVQHPKTKMISAMKIVNKKLIPYNRLKALEREISILKQLNHPHIITLKEVYESRNTFYLIMEKCDSDLMDLLKKFKKFPEMDTKRVITDLVSAVAYLHKKDIVHRDIKLDNVLVTSNPEDSNDKLFIKLCDFGLSIVKSGRSYVDMLHEKCGTLVYMAPEILENESYSQQCDVWAVGVMMYALLTGVLPFIASRDSAIIASICNFQPDYTKMASCTSACIDLLQKILVKNPASRLTATEILVHPWIFGKAVETCVSHNIIEMMRIFNDNKEDDADRLENDNKSLSKRKEEFQAHRNSVPVSVQNLAFDKSKTRVQLKPNGTKGKRSTKPKEKG